MIARLWHGRVASAKADAYLTYLHRSGVPDYRARYYSEDDDFLLEREPTVIHYDVVS